MVLRDSTQLPEATPDIYTLAKQLEIDLKIIEGIKKTRYLQSCPPVIKAGNLHLAWEYAQNPADHDRFINMLRISPTVFEVLLHLICYDSIVSMCLRLLSARHFPFLYFVAAVHPKTLTLVSPFF